MATIVSASRCDNYSEDSNGSDADGYNNPNGTVIGTPQPQEQAHLPPPIVLEDDSVDTAVHKQEPDEVEVEEVEGGGDDRDEDVQGDIFSARGAAYIAMKHAKHSSVRCSRCWLDVAQRRCICSRLPAIEFNDNFTFIVYMDHKEYYNPGDDAKLLLCTTRASQSHLVFYPHEDDKLLRLVRQQQEHSCVCVLFPSNAAHSFQEFSDTYGIPYLKKQQRGYTNNTDIADDTDTNTGNTTTLPLTIRDLPMTVIVVDAVWRNARKMAKRLRKLVPEVPQVQLTPEQMSVYARQQTQPDRICTVEATALFLKQCGEDEAKCDLLIECVKLNNAALKRKPQSVTAKVESTQKPTKEL